MSDVFVFAIGLLVTLIVTGAVGLLLWGAANEPRGDLVPARESDDSDAASRPAPSATTSAR